MKSITNKLNNAGIAEAINEVQSILKKKKYNNKRIINTSILIEESLIFYKGVFGEDKEFQIKLRLSILQDIRVVIEGQRKEFIINQEDSYLSQIYNMFVEFPSWSYKKGCNVLNIPFPKSNPSQFFYLICVMILVAIICFVAQLAPSDFIDTLKTGFITPTKDFLLDVLIGFTCPVIFFSVFFGILNVSDLSTLKNSGTKVIRSMFTIFIFLLLVAALCGLPLLNFEDAAQNNISIDAGKLYELVIGMFPSNPIKPFIECNAVQIIILAIVSSIICMLLGEKIDQFKRILFQASLFFERLLNLILVALPVIMFFVLMDAFIDPDLSLIASSLALLIFGLLGMLLMLILQVIILKLTSKVSLIEYFNQAKETLFVALTTASSMAALSSSIKLCTSFFRMDKNFVNFGIPICQVIYRPSMAFILCATGYFGSIQAGIPVNITWVISIIISSFLLACAIPPVPGGTLAIFTLLVSSFGIPNEFVAIAASVSIFLDFLSTCVNVQGYHTVLSAASHKIKKKKTQ